MSLLVGNNERLQAVISQLEETCRAINVSENMGGGGVSVCVCVSSLQLSEDPAGLALVCFQENGCRQKSKVCEAFDRLFALLEDRKCDMIVQINAEQEEKLDYIRGLRRRHSEHLETSAKLLETAIQTLDEPEMALFLQVKTHSLPRRSGKLGKAGCSHATTGRGCSDVC